MQPFEKFFIEWRSIKDKETISFEYSFDRNELFIEEIIFPWIDLFSYKIDELTPYCNAISIALWISYFKIFPTKTIELVSQLLADDQITFWKKFYREWLGEFFYVNNIDPNGIAETFISWEETR